MTHPIDDAWTHQLGELLDRLGEQGRVALPDIDGLEPRVLVRWLYRAWLEREGAWGPLLEVCAEHLPEQGPPPGWQAARGGWLWVDAPLAQGRLGAGLGEALELGQITLLEPAQGPALRAPARWRERAQELDAYHALASDPSLTELRRSLLSHCRGASSIHLAGEHGVGKIGLARWAHATLDGQPLSHVRGERGRHVPGQWLLVEEVAELGEQQRGLLEETMRARELLPGTMRRAGRARPRPEEGALEGIVGKDAGFVEQLWTARALAPRKLPVLLTGEPGVGKEILARAIHEMSGRGGEFVAVDMGAIPSGLFESELFGHIKGAFTDARQPRQGAFRRAAGGTLFLDEVGNLGLDLQVKLLRALQQRAVTPVGADRSESIDCRIITATNVDLEALASQGRFRLDLLGRLNAAVLHLPPLRQRRADIEPLARHFLSAHREIEPGRPWATPGALRIMERYTWPGNVRELANLIDYAAALTPEDEPLAPESLGHLSPRKRRRVPVLTTHSGESSLVQLGALDPSCARAICATTLTLPSVRARSRRARRHLIMQGLGGRPITPAALRLLEDYPWWGNLRELRDNLAVLGTLPPGPIRPEQLRQHLPHLLGAGARAPIQVLLSPSRGASGEVVGLSWEVDAAALLIGRTGRIEELTRSAAAGSARAKRWLERLEEVVPGGAPPACLELPFLRRLSRAHAVVTQGPRGLVVHQMPGVRLQVQARPLDDPEHERAEGDEGVELGQAGELAFVHPRTGRVYLQLFVFAGALAFEQFGGLALQAHQRLEQRQDRTLSDTTHHEGSLGPEARVAEADGGEEDEERLYRWALTEAEAAALVDICASFAGGMFKHHVCLCLEAYQGQAELERLVDYLERAPRMSQYVTRLFAYEHNEGLRELLAARAEAREDGQAWLELLPVGVRRSLE